MAPEPCPRGCAVAEVFDAHQSGDERVLDGVEGVGAVLSKPIAVPYSDGRQRSSSAARAWASPARASEPSSASVAASRLMQKGCTRTAKSSRTVLPPRASIRRSVAPDREEASMSTTIGSRAEIDLDANKAVVRSFVDAGTAATSTVSML